VRLTPPLSALTTAVSLKLLEFGTITSPLTKRSRRVNCTVAVGSEEIFVERVVRDPISFEPATMRAM